MTSARARWYLPALVLILMLGLLLRVGLWYDQGRAGSIGLGDEDEYYRGAIHLLLQGDYYDTGKWLRPPATSLYLAGAFAVLGADLPEYLSAAALGRSRLAGRALSRLLTAGVGEGTVLFALSNLVGGALGGWARNKELSAALARRCPPRELASSLDAIYRAEAAWKSADDHARAVGKGVHPQQLVGRPLSDVN